MGKNRSEPVVKAKKVKHYTRMQAERAIASGHTPPETFLDISDPTKKGGANHENYHVRAKAWKKLGSPIPETWNEEDTLKFYASIHFKNVEMEPAIDHTLPTENPA
jgi:hypothetical protein